MHQQTHHPEGLVGRYTAAELAIVSRAHPTTQPDGSLSRREIGPEASQVGRHLARNEVLTNYCSLTAQKGTPSPATMMANRLSVMKLTTGVEEYLPLSPRFYNHAGLEREEDPHDAARLGVTTDMRARPLADPVAQHVYQVHFGYNGTVQEFVGLLERSCLSKRWDLGAVARLRPSPNSAPV